MEHLLKMGPKKLSLEKRLTGAKEFGMKKDGSEGSPAKSVLEELEKLRIILNETVAQYQVRLEGEIDAIKGTFEKETGELSSAKMRDVRDMLTVLRNLDIKVDKGRRKDLRKIESVLGDIASLTEVW